MSYLPELKSGTEQAKSFFDSHSNTQLTIKKHSPAIENIKIWVENHLGKSGAALLKKHQDNFDPKKKFRLIHQQSKDKLDKITLAEYAVLFNNQELKDLLKKAGFTYLFQMSKTSFLHRACFLGLEKLIKRHLVEINDPNLLDEPGNAPLHVVLKSPLLTEGQKYNLTLTLIEDDRVNVNNQNKKGETALHLACAQGLLDLIGLLISLEDIKTSIKDKHSRTPLDRTHHLSHIIRLNIVNIFSEKKISTDES